MIFPCVFVELIGNQVKIFFDFLLFSCACFMLKMRFRFLSSFCYFLVCCWLLLFAVEWLASARDVLLSQISRWGRDDGKAFRFVGGGRGGAK